MPPTEQIEGAIQVTAESCVWCAGELQPKRYPSERFCSQACMQKFCNRRWYEANKQKTNDRARAWALANREQHNLSSRKSRKPYVPETDPEKRLKRQISSTLWKRTHTSRLHAAQRARKLGLRNLDVFTTPQWEDLKKRHDFTCLACKRAEPEIKLEADHVLPMANGGSNQISNIQPLCRACNAKKGAKHIDYRI